MRLLMDACVLFPTVQREILLGVAKTGAFTPIWSERLLEEWARAARKIGPTGELQARAEIALLRVDWPDACVVAKEGDLARLWLPDPGDIHVLAAAISGSADKIVTVNAKDFPRHILAEEGLDRIAPDELLYGCWLESPEVVDHAVAKVHETAVDMAGEAIDLRALLKRARLPKLGKALG